MRTVRVFPLSESPYASQIYAGLFDLAANHEISLEFTARPEVVIQERDWGKRTNNRIVYLEIWNDRELICKVCMDLMDGPAMISLSGLEFCDIYFKRSYSQEYIDSVQDYWQEDHPEWRSKIVPYGLNFPCFSDHEASRVFRSLTFARATNLWRDRPRGAFHRVKESLFDSLSVKRAREKPGRWCSSNETPLIALLEQPAEDLVMFQTRLFDPVGRRYAHEVEALNEHRVQVVRALRQHFGERFAGGLWPEPYARERYPDLLTNQSTKRSDYLELVKSSKVVVFTRGLRQSNGWRLPEYLGYSRCIVSEPLAFKLPVPLEQGRNILYFENIQECLESCDRLLSDPQLAAKMRRANLQYFQENVSAGALARKILARAENFKN